MKKKVLITGSTGLLGRRISKFLLDKGWDLLISGRNINKLEELRDVLNKVSKKKVDFVDFDLNDENELKNLDDRLISLGFNITHIVNNARSLDNLEIGKDGITSSDKFMDEFRVNVVSPYLISIKIANNKKHNLETIVNIGSQYGSVAPNPNLYENFILESPIQYGVTKSALHHLTKELAVRLAPSIRVNSVAYGGFKVDNKKEFVDKYSKLNPGKRMLNLEEVGGPVNFLLDSNESSSINGHTLMADLGWSIW